MGLSARRAFCRPSHDLHTSQMNDPSIHGLALAVGPPDCTVGSSMKPLGHSRPIHCRFGRPMGIVSISPASSCTHVASSSIRAPHERYMCSPDAPTPHWALAWANRWHILSPSCICSILAFSLEYIAYPLYRTLWKSLSSDSSSSTLSSKVLQRQPIR